MSDVRVYVEGGGGSKELQTRCREGFRKLFEKCGFRRSPRLIACGSRREAYDSFCTAIKEKNSDIVFLLVDSEDPIADTDKPWGHLKQRDGWDKPDDASDDQVLLMATCMETWIIADRDGLKRHYERHKRCLKLAGLPSTINLKTKDRHVVQQALITATEDCDNAYAKNKRSFDALANVDPAVISPLLPQLARMIGILSQKL